MNANVPFEFVTPDDLRNGLAMRYKVIYLPAIISLQNDVLDILGQYTADGGRVVLDLPGGKFDENTVITNTGKGSTFAKLFGATLDNYQFSGSNKTISLKDKEWTGFVVDMTPIEAKTMDYYSTGKPAIVENKYGSGFLILDWIGYLAPVLQARKCFWRNKFWWRRHWATWKVRIPVKGPWSIA